jgi:hypothetical protein
MRRAAQLARKQNNLELARRPTCEIDSHVALLATMSAMFTTWRRILMICTSEAL